MCQHFTVNGPGWTVAFAVSRCGFRRRIRARLHPGQTKFMQCNKYHLHAGSSHAAMHAYHVNNDLTWCASRLSRARPFKAGEYPLSDPTLGRSKYKRHDQQPIRPDVTDSRVRGGTCAKAGFAGLVADPPDRSSDEHQRHQSQPQNKAGSLM